MQPRRSAGDRADAIRSDAAARRLALIASGLGASPAAAAPPTDPGTGPHGPDGDPDWWADHTRVANHRSVEPAPVTTGAPALPVPGRHAARRRRPLPSPRLGAGLRARMPTLGASHVAVLALAIAVGLAVTTWWVVRDQPREAPRAPLTGQTASPLVADLTSGAGPAGVAPSATPSAPGGTVTVDVAGKVRRPGIVVLEQGARVTDALAEAGGARQGVDLTPLNLARVLVDGEQIVVGAPPGAGAAPGVAGAGPGAGPGSGSAGALVNLNTAGQAELEALPQVGPVTAQSILGWREQNGGFTSVEELLEIDGIGEKTLAQLLPHVTV